MTVERFGKSALGRDKFHVVINELETKSQRRGYANWQKVRRYRSKILSARRTCSTESGTT